MKIFILISAIFLSACASNQQAEKNREVDVNLSDLLLKGAELLNQNNAKKAIDNYFDLVIQHCETEYANKDIKFYASRSPVETLYYMTNAAAKNIAATAIGIDCSDALYLKGYAKLNLGNVEDAEVNLKRAIEMAPVNSHYLSELGHIYHVKRDWETALALFVVSESYANTFSPDDVKTKELLRAKRGIAYSLIEQGNLDEAEKKLRECLVIDSEDEGALGELAYIDSLRENFSSTENDSQ